MPVTREYTHKFDMTVTPTGGTVVLSFHVAWADIDDALAEIFPPTSGGTIGANELDPYLSRYRASTVKISKIVDNAVPTNDTTDPADIVPHFEKAELTVTYTNEQAQIPSDQDEADADGDPVPFLSHSWSTGTELIEQETSESKFTRNVSVKSTAPVSKVITLIQHQIDWVRVVSPPFATIRALLGKVNDSNMDFATGTILPETCLFVGATLQREYMSDGEKSWRVGYQFSERRVDIQFGLSVDVAYSTPDVAAFGGGYLPVVDYVPSDPAKYGGWNHFYDAVGEKGFARLYLRPPFGTTLVNWTGKTAGSVTGQALNAITYGAYDAETAPYKAGDLGALFTQV